MLRELETWAAELNFTSLILETGKAQPEAIGLYTKSGYNIIPNYGQYENVENSVCMKKAIINSVEVLINKSPQSGTVILNEQTRLNR